MTLNSTYQSSKISVAAAFEPLTTAEAATHLKIDPVSGSTYTDGTYIDGLVKAARIYCEQFLDMSICSKTYIDYHSAFPATVNLRWANVTAVSSIAYVDDDGANQTLTPGTDTQSDLNQNPAIIQPVYNTVWPDTRSELNAVAITYVAGYADADSVPETIKEAIKLIIHDWYEYRGQGKKQNRTMTAPNAADMLLNQYRVAYV